MDCGLDSIILSIFKFPDFDKYTEVIFEKKSCSQDFYPNISKQVFLSKQVFRIKEHDECK